MADGIGRGRRNDRLYLTTNLLKDRGRCDPVGHLRRVVLEGLAQQLGAMLPARVAGPEGIHLGMQSWTDHAQQ